MDWVEGKNEGSQEWLQDYWSAAKIIELPFPGMGKACRSGKFGGDMNDQGFGFGQAELEMPVDILATDAY